MTRKKLSAILFCMGARLFVEFEANDFLELSKLLEAYAKCLKDAHDGFQKSEAKDGLKTIHCGLKAIRKLTKEYVGSNNLPDDSKFDEIVQQKLVDSGLAPRYDVENGRDLKPAQILKQARKVAESQIAYESGKRKRKNRGD